MRPIQVLTTTHGHTQGSCGAVIDPASPEVTRPAQPFLPKHTEYCMILGERKRDGDWRQGLPLRVCKSAGDQPASANSDTGLSKTDPGLCPPGLP